MQLSSSTIVWVDCGIWYLAKKSQQQTALKANRFNEKATARDNGKGGPKNIYLQRDRCRYVIIIILFP